MKCKVEGCRFSDKHNTRDHQCGKCKRYSHGQRECDSWSKQEDLINTIDKDEYYPGRIIISYDENSNKDNYFPYQSSSYNKIRKELGFDTYFELGSGMGCTVLYKKISNDRILMKVLDDVDHSSGKADIIRKSFVGNRIKQDFKYDIDYRNKPIIKEENREHNINGIFYAPVL